MESSSRPTELTRMTTTEPAQGAVFGIIQNPIIVVSLSTFALYLVSVVYLDAYLAYLSASLAWFQPSPMTLLTFTYGALVSAVVVAFLQMSLFLFPTRIPLWRLVYWVWVALVLVLNYLWLKAGLEQSSDLSFPWMTLFTLMGYLLFPPLLRQIRLKTVERLQAISDGLTSILAKPVEQWDLADKRLWSDLKEQFGNLRWTRTVQFIYRLQRVLPPFSSSRLVDQILNLSFFCFALVGFTVQLGAINAHRHLTDSRYWFTLDKLPPAQERLLFSDGTRLLTAGRGTEGYVITYRDDTLDKVLTLDFR